MHTLSDAQNLALRYAQIADDRKFDDMREIISNDFTQKGPHWQCENANDFIATLGFLKETYSATFHLVGNQLGQWYEDHYEGETYCIASHIYEKDGQGRKLDMAIRYQERVEYIDGRYCYTRRDVNIVWSSDQSLHQ
jgi:hypothetical protein